MESLIDQIEFVDKASPPPLLLPSMGSMMKGKIFVENLMRENSLKGLFGLKKDELTWEEEEAEAEKEEEQISATEGAGISSFGRSTKWVREFSSSAKVVAARCAK